MRNSSAPTLECTLRQLSVSVADTQEKFVSVLRVGVKSTAVNVEVPGLQVEVQPVVHAEYWSR